MCDIGKEGREYTVIPVTGGTFECPHCYARWVGTWHGHPDLITCIRCEKPIKEVDEDD